MSGIDMRRGQHLFDRHVAEAQGGTEFTLLGRTWDLLDRVFSPAATPVTTWFTENLPYPVGGSFLEMGCGTGVTSVVAALSGCRTVTALDISAAAVENTRLNAVRHGVDDRVRVERSDLFSALDPDERFDVVFWNSNFTEAPADFVNSSDLHHAFFDPDYSAHRRFVREAPGRLTEGGRLLLGFGSIGNEERLAQDCADAGLRIDPIWSRRFEPDPDTVVEFQILEIRPN